MRVASTRLVNLQQASFMHRPKEVEKTENPISRKGEVANLTKATFVAGLGIAAKLFWELIEDGEFEFEILAKKASKLVDKNKKGLTKDQRSLYKIGAFVSLLAASFAGFAVLYTIFKTPEIAYKSKVNAFTKSKEMDVYMKANEAEKEIYAQLAEKGEHSDGTEKDELKKQYSKMVIAKNQVPEFAK